MFKVAHAVKVRLTKEREQARGSEDEKLEAAEECNDDDEMREAFQDLMESHGLVDFGGSSDEDG
ncbi:hypothetical protein BG005_003333, partial [Podila minutissima]